MLRRSPMNEKASRTGPKPAFAESPKVFAVMLILVGAVGSALRLYAFKDQVLLDDEWHGLYYVIGKNVTYLLTHFSVPGATSIPLNLYAFALLHAVGWNEAILRLPSLAAGIASLVVLPMLAARLVGRTRACVFGAILAISPFLVFYSRVARPYSATVLLGILAVFAGCLWIRDGNRRYGIAYVLSAVAAVYFHLYAAPAVAAPLLCAMAFRAPREKIGARRLMLCGLGMVAALGVLLVPALVESLGSTMATVIRTGEMTWQTMWHVASLLSGTGNVAVILCFLGLVVWGAVGLFRKDRLSCTVLLTSILLCVAAFVVSAPKGMHSPIVVSRYAIVLFPIAYLFVACAAGDAGRWALRKSDPMSARVLGTLAAMAMLGGLFVVGPLIPLYAPQNNFTNHIVFQQSYEPLSWERSHEREFIRPESTRAAMTFDGASIAPFYSMLAADDAAHTIIEYPMLVGDHFNPYYYYQHFHARRVLIGYLVGLSMRPAAGGGGFIYGNTFVDEVLGMVPDPSTLHLRNMVNAGTGASIRASGADYIVIHKRFEAEFSGLSGPTPPVDYVEMVCRRSFGRPVFVNENLVAFAVRR
jgi:hypothetical protein